MNEDNRDLSDANPSQQQEYVRGLLKDNEKISSGIRRDVLELHKQQKSSVDGWLVLMVTLSFAVGAAIIPILIQNNPSQSELIWYIFSTIFLVANGVWITVNMKRGLELEDKTQIGMSLPFEISLQRSKNVYARFLLDLIDIDQVSERLTEQYKEARVLRDANRSKNPTGKPSILMDLHLLVFLFGLVCMFGGLVSKMLSNWITQYVIVCLILLLVYAYGVYRSYLAVTERLREKEKLEKELAEAEEEAPV